jgi:hypothetical protein
MQQAQISRSLGLGMSATVVGWLLDLNQLVLPDSNGSCQSPSDNEVHQRCKLTKTPLQQNCKTASIALFMCSQARLDLQRGLGKLAGQCRRLGYYGLDM